MLRAIRGPWWGSHKIGLSRPPIEKWEGWLLPDGGVRKTSRLCGPQVAFVNGRDGSRITVRMVLRASGVICFGISFGRA